jgi:hypothetical protein
MEEIKAKDNNKQTKIVGTNKELSSLKYDTISDAKKKVPKPYRNVTSYYSSTNTGSRFILLPRITLFRFKVDKFY